jgi:hypothetical protein
VSASERSLLLAKDGFEGPLASEVPVVELDAGRYSHGGTVPRFRPQTESRGNSSNCGLSRCQADGVRRTRRVMPAMGGNFHDAHGASQVAGFS